MSEPEELRVPTITVVLRLEDGVRLGIDDAEEADIPRLLEWIDADPLRRLIIAAALALGQPRKGDLACGDEILGALAEQLERVPAEAPPGPALDPHAAELAAIVPLGSYQGQTLRRVLRDGESGRRWLQWAVRRSWPLDVAFGKALRIVCEREGISPNSGEDEAGTP